MGGAEIYLEGLIGYVLATPAATGPPLDVHLICRSDTVLDAWAARIAAAGVRVHRLDLTSIADLGAARRVMREVEIIHMVLAYPIGKYQLVTALLAQISRRPLVITHQLVIDVKDVISSAFSRAFWQTAFGVYRVARWNIASSHAGLALLTRGYNFSKRSTVLIFNGADVGRFTPLRGAPRTAMRAAIGQEVAAEPWTDATPLACTVARLSPQKGLHYLVEAAAIVAARVPAARFLLVGDGPLRQELEQQVRRLQLERNVLFAGGRSLDQVASWLAATDLFVLSSLNEGMPLSLVEAMAAGCPAVATAVGGVPDIINDRSVGRLVPARNPEALAQAIIEVFSDRSELPAMSAAARERAVNTFNVETCYRRTVDLYRDQPPPVS